MAIDPSIALGVRPIELPNQLAQYGQMQQILAAQDTQQMNALKMQEARATMDERNMLRRLDPTASDYEAQLFRVSPQLGINYRKEASAAKASNAATSASLAAAAQSKQNLLSQALRDISGRPSDANIIAYAEDIGASSLFSTEEKARAVALQQTLLAIPFEERGAYLASQGAKPGDLLTASTAAQGQKVTMRGQDLTASTAAQGQKVTMRGQNMTASTAAAGQQVTMRGQDLTDARAKENIAIAKETQRREADPAFQQQIAQARALGVNIAKDKVVRDAALPKVLDTAEMTLSEIDGLIGKRDAKGNLLEGEKPHPGFEGTVGATYLPGARFIPGTAQSDFQTRFDQIKGSAFLQAFETLKGGGSITNVEGEKGTAALNRMSLAQSEPEFLQAAQEFKGIISKGVERAKKLAGGTAAGTPTVVDFGSLK